MAVVPITHVLILDYIKKISVKKIIFFLKSYQGLSKNQKCLETEEKSFAKITSILLFFLSLNLKTATIVVILH